METNRAMDTDAPRLEVVAELGALAIGAGLFKRPRQSTARQRSQPLWIPLSTENRTNDSHASDPGDVRDHLRELYVHLLEGFLLGGVPHQHGTLAKITPQHADLIVGPECPGQKPKGMELLDPLAVEHIALSPWHVLQQDRPASRQNHARPRVPHSGIQ